MFKKINILTLAILAWSFAGSAVAQVSASGVYGTAGTLADKGAIIIDNTANPGRPGVVTNMDTKFDSNKAFNVHNSFNIDEIQVMQRDISVTPHRLDNEAGVTNTKSTKYKRLGTAEQLNYFADGKHLFDLDRLRRAANWMRVPGDITLPDAALTTASSPGLMTTSIPANQITATADCTGRALRTTGKGTPIGSPIGSCHQAGTYGTITWREFLENIRDARTMYGVVRILVPLQVSSATGTGKNSLNAIVNNNTMYGFCTGTTEWCANAPTSSTSIKGGEVVGGNNAAAITMPAISTTGAQLRVRGSLMFDFVNGTEDSLGSPGHPIPLANLPFDPREIYFKIIVPINVNAVNDKTGDGIKDNIVYIGGLTSVITCTSYPCSTIVPNATTIASGQVPMEAIDAYNYAYGTSYTSNADSAFTTLWSTLNLPNKYHMLMGSGYVDGWFDAFKELNITAQQWKDLGFSVPLSATLGSTLTEANIRSSEFEDLPTYLYSGGLVDMHHHMNISGLLYVPQAAEIEQKSTLQYMYMSGALVIRNGFFLEARAGSVTIVSSDPQSYDSLKVQLAAIQYTLPTQAYSTKHSASTTSTLTGQDAGLNGAADSTEKCVGCNKPGAGARRVEWIEIRPR